MCVPSRSEGFGLVAIEAMAMGRPVLGSSVEGLKEVVEDGVSGLLFEKESIEGCASAMRRVTLDIQLRTRLMRGARERGAEFTIENTVQGKKRFLLDVIEDHSRRERES